MTTQATHSNKNNPFKVSEQVKNILHSKGLSKVFNYADYEHFKQKCIKAFNKPQAIANLFIDERLQDSDLNEYQF